MDRVSISPSLRSSLCICRAIQASGTRPFSCKNPKISCNNAACSARLMPRKSGMRQTSQSRRTEAGSLARAAISASCANNLSAARSSASRARRPCACPHCTSPRHHALPPVICLPRCSSHSIPRVQALDRSASALRCFPPRARSAVAGRARLAPSPALTDYFAASPRPCCPRRVPHLFARHWQFRFARCVSRSVLN